MAGINHGGAPLPEEIITDILARLPAKSAGRFRCVSRAWRATLSSAYFLDLHARRANRRGRPKLLLCPVGSSYDGYIYSWQPGGQVEKLMPDCFKGAGVVSPLTKPCRGLILIRTDNGGYFVSNPSTGAALPLPDSKMPLKTSFLPSKLHRPDPPPCFLEVSYGLGYCAARKEYKVVRLFTNLETEDGPDLHPPSCDVFVLDTAAYWRPTAENPPLCFVKEDRPAVFIETAGCLHFLCCDGSIVTFNVSRETFGSLPPPPGFHNVVPVLTELDGCLCFCYGEPDSEDPYHVCVLRDYKEAKWEKLCCIDRIAWPESDRVLLKSLWIAPLGIYYAGDAQKILFGTGTCKVFAVDPEGGAPQILLVPDDTIIGSCDDGHIPELGSFEDSLVPVGNTIEEMVFSSPITEAWFNILKWLPTDSVLELSLVCRTWRAMIMTDCFIQSHVMHANLKRSPRIMFIMDSRFGHYLDIEDCAGGVCPQLCENLVCSQPCHGLNVGSTCSYDFICNPVMGYSEHLPLDDNDGTSFTGRIGLGYDMEINKHVVVRITYKERNFETGQYELQCKVRYVIDKEWRPVEPPPRPIADTPPTFVNGKIYWMVEPNLGPVSARCEIVAFDVKSDEFEVLQGPPCSHDSGRMTILQLEGALCVSCSDPRANTIDIWMMRDFGIWSVEYHIELQDFLPVHYSSENAAPLVDPKDGRILLNTGCLLGYYDPKTTAIETIYAKDVALEYPEFKFCPIICHESLVYLPDRLPQL